MLCTLPIQSVVSVIHLNEYSTSQLIIPINLPHKKIIDAKIKFFKIFFHKIKLLAQRRNMFDIPKCFVHHEKNKRFKIYRQQTLPVVRENIIRATKETFGCMYSIVCSGIFIQYKYIMLNGKLSQCRFEYICKTKIICSRFSIRKDFLKFIYIVFK